MQRSVSVIGIGSTPFGVLEGVTLEEMTLTACNDAILDAGIERRQIDAFFLGNYVSGVLTGQETLAPMVAYGLGLRPDITAIKVEGACCSSSLGVRLGFELITSGARDLVLVAGAEKMTSQSTAKATQALAAAMDPSSERILGLTFPGFFAQVAHRHMYEFGTTEVQMAHVSMKNHENSASNPRARFRDPVPLEKILSSKPVADPLKLFDCCPMSDGAAAVILCRSDMASEFSARPVDIVGSGIGRGLRTTHETINETGSITSLPATVTASQEAFRMAGLKPSEIDVVELHDCFTIAEIVDSEDLGLFEKGRGGTAALEGLTAIDGEIPINPSGGLLSKGHPVGATGCGQIFEIVKQLRGEHENQVQDAEFGLTHNLGGSGAIGTVHIFRRRS